MTEILYVVTADIMNREEDGRDHQDGSTIFRSFQTRETWTFPASTPIGTIMEEVNKLNYQHSYVTSVGINEDRITAEKAREERYQARRAKEHDNIPD